MDMLEQWGPDGHRSCTIDEARALCRRLTLGQYENFSVLSAMVPARCQEGVCAIYAWCRWADDLADEAGSPARAATLLEWWRSQLHECFQGRASHPVLMALAEVIERHQLTQQPFDHLLDAFEWDQRQARWETWDDLLAYCRGSADPVGRLVLAVAGVHDGDDIMNASDAVCTGLQLANHWQDVRRDVVDRDRIYIPQSLMPDGDFEQRLVLTAFQGHAPDHSFLASYRALMATLIQRTRPMFDSIDRVLEAVPPDMRPMVWLFAAGGRAVLDGIERSDHETVLYRPRVSKLQKLMLILQARGQGRAA